MSTQLDASTRHELVTAMARRTVKTLLTSVGKVVVVSPEARWARESLAPLQPHRVEVIAQPCTVVGLNAALDHGRRFIRDGGSVRGSRGANPDVRDRGAGEADGRHRDADGEHGDLRLLIAHADLPALTPDDVVAVLSPGGDVVCATDRPGLGTNMLALTASQPFTFRFGPGSLAAHRREAADRGLRFGVVERVGSAHDLDTAADWAALPGQARAELLGQVPGLAVLPTG